MSAVAGDNKSLGQLFSDLMGETRTLIRQEVDLAKTEAGQKAAIVGRNVGFIAAGGLVLLMGALPVIAGIVIAVGHKIGYATSSFIVGALFIAIGAVLVTKGLNALKRTNLAPAETKAQVKETTQWMKEQTR